MLNNILRNHILCMENHEDYCWFWMQSNSMKYILITHYLLLIHRECFDYSSTRSWYECTYSRETLAPYFTGATNGGLMVLIFVIHPSMRGPFVDFDELVVRKNCITRLRDLSAQTFCRVYIYVNAMLHRREALYREGCNVMAYLSRGIKDNHITYECYK